jgi:hypothetical protein
MSTEIREAVFDNEAMTLVDQVYAPTHSCSAGAPTTFSPAIGEQWHIPGSGPIADALSARPKYVASKTLTDPKWSDTTSSPVTSRRPSES